MRAAARQPRSRRIFNRGRRRQSRRELVGRPIRAGKRNPWLVVLVISLAMFMEVLDTSIASVSINHIAGSLAVSNDESTWVLTAYLVANAIIVPISGWLSDVIGRKRFYMLSVAMFTIASLVCGLPVNLPMLVAARIIQGLGGGGLATSEQSFLADTFPLQNGAWRSPPMVWS